MRQAAQRRNAADMGNDENGHAEDLAARFLMVVIQPGSQAYKSISMNTVME